MSAVKTNAVSSMTGGCGMPSLSLSRRHQGAVGQAQEPVSPVSQPPLAWASCVAALQARAALRGGAGRRPGCVASGGAGAEGSASDASRLANVGCVAGHPQHDYPRRRSWLLWPRFPFVLSAAESFFTCSAVRTRTPFSLARGMRVGLERPAGAQYGDGAS